MSLGSEEQLGEIIYDLSFSSGGKIHQIPVGEMAFQFIQDFFAFSVSLFTRFSTPTHTV